MILKFSKMHGLGNDFIMIDAINQSVNLSTETVRFLADRRFGIGCDQLLLVESSAHQDIDFRYRIFNADGGEVEQCGNGARCFARFVHDQGLTDKTSIRVQTLSGIIEPALEPDGRVTVNMGVPDFEPDRIVLKGFVRSHQYHQSMHQEQYTFGAVSMGNPHMVIPVDNVNTANVEEAGKYFESHPMFPNRVNVGFMQIINRNKIKLRVYERGTGETLACGTGACAAVAVGRDSNWLDDNVDVELTGGSLSIKWSGEEAPLWMTGPAEKVFTGSIEI